MNFLRRNSSSGKADGSLRNRLIKNFSIGFVGSIATAVIGMGGSPYKTVQVNNFNKLHITASGNTWRKIRWLQSKTGRYFQTCIAL